jgi:hypothetical protein
MIQGGPLESIYLSSTRAAVLFLHADDCLKFFLSAANGIVYGNLAGRDLVAFVELGKDVDVIGGQLQLLIDTDATRCVRVVGVGAEVTREELEGLPRVRRHAIEHMQEQKGKNGVRIVVFRFCKIQDASAFKKSLVRDPDWEHCNIQYEADP